MGLESMDPIGVFSGLSSGIDWRTMVDQIIQVESQPIYNYEDRISQEEARKSAWESFRSLVSDLESSASALGDGSAFQVFSASTRSLSTSTGTPLGAQPTTDAAPGTYQAKVHRLATQEKLGGDIFADRTTALGFSGEFLVGGVAVQVQATDSLNDVMEAIDRANTGANASGVTASVLTKGAEEYYLVLTADDPGEAGIDLADGSGGVLQSLGFLDGATRIKNQTSNGAASDTLTSGSQAVGTLLALTDPPAAASVTMGTGANQFSVSLDLSTMSLTDVASAINTAASGAGSSVTASVESVTDSDGANGFQLEISGTTTFADANGILQTMGVVEGGRGSVTQALTSESAFTDGDASTTATTSSLLTNLWVGGAAGGVTTGDTLTISGTRGDGSTFSRTFSVGASDTLQDLLDDLNSATDGFGYGDRTATAGIDGSGRLVVTDGTSGDSRLALSIVANNEGGGVLDFGDMTVSSAGRAREIVAGANAQVEVDGTFVERSSNKITDIIPGVTLTLYSASEETATIEISRNDSAIKNSIEGFVEKYNTLTSWVGDQFSGAGAEEGTSKKPLSGNGILRDMRNSLHDAMLTELAAAVGGDMSRLARVGIEVDQTGVYQVDSSELSAAIESDPEAVRRLFGVYGSGSISSIGYVSSEAATDTGTYALEITQAASQASVAGTGFSGTYVDDGTPDTITIRDLGTDSEFSVSLTNGMTVAQIVSSLNSEFNTAAAHQVQATEGMYADAVGTAATNSTLLKDLHNSGGSSLGVADGDTITISGTQADATSFLVEFQVTDINTQTLGDLRSAIETAVGSGETVTWEGGLLTVTGQETGRSSLSLSLSSDNAGGGSLSFGSVAAVTEGRGVVDITASAQGNQLSLAHGEYGSATGFEVSFSGGGADNTSSLGLTAGTYRGQDVTGTIGGHAATGTGQFLEGDAGTAVEGLMLRYEGADTGSVGSFTFSRGIGSAMDAVADLILGTEAGSIDAVVENIDPSIDRINDRIDELESRLERRRADLIKRFTVMEEALTMAQQQSQWIAAQLGTVGTTES